MSRLLAALAALLLTMACAVPGTVQARAFSTGFRAGDALRYKIHTVVAGSLSLGGQQLPLNSDQTLTEKLRVDSVDHAGTATVAVTVEDMIDESTGASTPSTSPPVTLTVAADGRIVSGSAAQLGGRVPSIPGSDQLTPILPTAPVRPGDSWDRHYERANPFGSGGFKFDSHGTYVRNESVSGQDAAVIDVTLQGPVDFTIDRSKLPPVAGQPAAQGAIHYTGAVANTTRYWIALGGQQVLKSSGSGTYSITYALAGPAGDAGALQRATFNGQIKTELTRL